METARSLQRVEVHGKNLFYFFAQDAQPPVVLHGELIPMRCDHLLMDRRSHSRKQTESFCKFAANGGAQNLLYFFAQGAQPPVVLHNELTKSVPHCNPI